MSYQTPNDGLTADDKLWGMLSHLLALSTFVIPFGNIIAPLVIWQVKKDTMPFVAENAKESLNFNITASIAGFISGLLIIVLIGWVLFPAVMIAWLAFTIIAGLKANEGHIYRYPYTLRLVS
jgi:uncharacterized protein